LGENKTRIKDQSVTVQGWVRTKRELKEFTFLEVNDGSSLANLQVILEPTLPDYENVLKAISTGAAIAVSGNLVPSPGKGQNIELKAAEITLYGDCPADYPLQKKRHSFEFLRTIAHLRARTNTLGAVMRVRNACATAIHTFFQEKGFIWVHTPIITMALSNVYTFGPTFRAENSNTSRHLAEFWMVEPEMAFCDLEGDQDLAEAFLKYIFKFVLENCPEDLQFFNERIDKTVLSTAENIVNSEFGRITYSEAIELLEKADRQFEFPVEWGVDLQSEHERYLAEELFKKPVIVTNYPKTIKAFYMRLDDNNKTVSAMDILAPKIGEIIGGSQREERLDVLIQRMQEQGMNPDDLWWYLDLRRYGSVPHAGFGLGFERLVQFMTGMTNIRDVIPFPRTPLSADF